MKKIFFILAMLIFISSSVAPVFAEDVDTSWVARYNGQGNGEDKANAIAVDDSGYVYVTGRSLISGQINFDYITIKYFPYGDTIWTRGYDGGGNAWDEARAITVDASGNVYITGRSVHDDPSGYDYATIKYLPNSDTAWVRRYKGPGNSIDMPHDIAIDDSGNVYVTGESGVTPDYATIKYGPNGNELWVKTYNGPGNGYDIAYAIAVDNSGNVYITGESRGSSTQFDYATVKYYPNGDTAWVRRYDATGGDDYARAIIVDESGNVFITGISYGGAFFSDDFVTVRYDSLGNKKWAVRYGEAYPDDPNDIALDNSDNIYVVGRKNNDFATVKYDSSGHQIWAKTYNGPGNISDEAYSIAVDDSGNIYVTGYSNGGSATDNDYTTIKYYPNGDTAWLRKYNGPGSFDDKASDIAVDYLGNVYMTGFSYGSGTNFDYTTIKYGLVLTANFIGEPTSGYRPLTVQFTDLSVPDPIRWHWDFGDGETDTVQNPVHTYQDTGRFDVELIVYDSTSSDILVRQHYIAVVDSFIVDFTATPTRGRKPLNVSFQSLCSAPPDSVIWYFGDGNTSHALNPEHLYDEMGSYNVKLVAVFQGFKDSLEKENFVRTSDINAEFSVDKRCGPVPLEVNLSDGSTSSYPITNWHWSLGDGSIYSIQNPTHQYTISGVFDITLIVSDSIGADTLAKNDYIIAQDSISADYIGLPNSGQPPLTVMFEPVLEGTASSYYWDFGDGDTSDLKNPIHTYETAGKYSPKLRVELDLDSCHQIDSLIKEDYIVVNDLEALFSASPMAGLSPLTVQFYDTSSGTPNTWFWNFGDGFTSTEQDPQHQYDTAGAYDVFLRVTNTYGADSLLKLKYILVDTLWTDLFTEIYSDQEPRPGFPHNLFFVWTNIGTNPAENCTLKFLPPANMTINDIALGQIISGTYTGYNFSGDTIIVPLATIDPSNWFGGYIFISGTLPESVPIGDTLTCQAWLTTTTADQDTENNYFILQEEVIGSWDPNEKSINPAGWGIPHYIKQGQRLEYKIQFENLPEATAEAIYIRVVDTLSQNLGWSTLTIGVMSHPEKCSYEFDPYTGVIIWYCDSIMLPPNQNPPEGEGWFTFSISPIPNLEGGTLISNSAWIRFDYNRWIEAGPVNRTIEYPFIRGDVTGNGIVDVGDVVFLINYLYKNGNPPVPLESGDVTCNDIVDIGDVVFLINYLYKSGPPPSC